MQENRVPVRVLDPTDISIHGAAALGAVLALATAPFLHLPTAAPGLGRIPSWLHLAGALLATAAWVLHGVRVCLAWLNGQSPWGLAPRSGDLSDVVGALRYGAGLSTKRPNPGRYSYRERFPYAGFLVLLPVLLVTGGITAFPGAAAGLLGGAGVFAASSLHLGAGIFVLPLLLWHLFFALLQPGVLPWNGAWITGKVPWERLVRTRPGWAQAILAGEALPEVQAEPEAASVEEILSQGNLAAREGRYEEAEAAYLKALELYPGYSQALFNLGVARWKSGNRVGAKETLTAFLEHDPFNPMAPKATQILSELGEGELDG